MEFQDILFEYYENYIYFMGAFKKGKQIHFTFKEQILKPFQTSIIEDNERIEYEIKVFRIDKKNLEFKEEFEKQKFQIILEDEEGDFKASIEKRINKEGFTFLFNTKFKRKTFFTEKYPSSQYFLSNEKQYEIYRKLIDLKNKAHITDLVNSAETMIIQAEHYEFAFFVTIFSDIIYINDLLIYSQLFNIKKVNALGIISENNLDRAKSLINLNFENPEEKMIQTKVKEKKEKILNKMALFLFYFNCQYQKDKIINIINNKYYSNYIYQKLIEKNKEFLDVNLPKNCINKLISLSKNFDELAIIISYNKDVLETLEIINENKNLFNEKIKFELKKNGKEKKKKDISLKIDKNIIKKSDNMEKIKVQIQKIFSTENELNFNFIFFPKIFFETYVDKYNNENNINDLIQLIEVIKLFKANNKSNLGYKSLLRRILDKLMEFISEGKIKNNDLLILIKNIIYLSKEDYQENDNKSKVDYLTKIFQGINISKINDEFIKCWKEVEWLKIFKNSENQFYHNVCNIIKNMKDFGKLFSIFDINQKEKDYDISCLLIIKEKFKYLLNDYSKEECPNFLEDVANLIYYLNIKDLSFNSLIDELLEKYIQKNELHNIYYKIYSNNKFNIIHNDLNKTIIEFYKNNKTFINPIYFGFYIKNNKGNVDNEFLSEINDHKYNIEENEIYNLDETENFKLLKNIIENNLIDNISIKKYIQIHKDISIFIIENIIKGDVKYIYINKFYSNNKKNELFQRLTLISCLIDNEKDKKSLKSCIEIIETNMNNINKIIIDLENIKKKIQVFFPNTKRNDIKKMISILENIKKNNLFYYKNEIIKEEIDFYLNQNDLRDLNPDMEKGNIFFKIFYKEKKEKYKDNEILIMKETEKDMKNFINILQANSIKNIEINNLGLILNKLNKEEKNNLGREIDKLIEQYKLNLNRDKLVHDLMLISKKNIIYNMAEDFLSLIEMTKVEQEEFTQINKTIVKYLGNPIDVNVIELSMELLKNYDIEFNEESNYKYLELLDLLKKKNNIIEFLLEITLKKCIDLLDFFDKNNYEKGDITSLVECKTFFDKFLKNNIKDKDIIKSFINELSQSEGLEIEFSKLINSYDVILNMLPMIEEQ